MHMHQSLVEAASGKYVFSDSDGKHTDKFNHYIAGLQKYVPAAMVFFAPNVNSYRRIMRDESAPINVRWGMDNIKEKLMPTEPLTGSAYDLPFQLPRSLESAMALLNDCKPLTNILGERFVEAYIAVKKKSMKYFFE